MSWPVEYQVVQLKHAGADRVEQVYLAWIADGRNEIGRRDQFTEKEANYRLSGLTVYQDPLARDWWPDRIVDLISELVCCDGYIIYGRDEPQGEWRRLEPGFKDGIRREASTNPPAKDDRHARAARLRDDGYTDDQIGARLGVSERTIRRWLNGR